MRTALVTLSIFMPAPADASCRRAGILLPPPPTGRNIQRTKVRITKSEISMRTWRSPMSAASQGAFVVIPEISLCDISYITKKRADAQKRGVQRWKLNEMLTYSS